MRKIIYSIFFSITLLISCKPAANETTAILLNENGYNVNGQLVTYEELYNTLQELRKGHDADSISIQMAIGYSHDQMYELKRLLKEANITNIKEIK